MLDKRVRTTIALPVELLKAADAAVRAGKAKSRNDLLARSLRNELAILERTAIDAAFAGMAHDADYQKEASKIPDEFAGSDWEAFQAGEEPS